MKVGERNEEEKKKEDEEAKTPSVCPPRSEKCGGVKRGRGYGWVGGAAGGSHVFEVASCLCLLPDPHPASSPLSSV